METEYGSNQPVRIASGTMFNSSGVEIKCKCGNSAGSALMGKAAFIAYCSDCSPCPKDDSLELIYRKPDVNDPKYKEALKWLS